MQGVKAVIAESFERIHRSNLVGMGILPLQFLDGQSAESLKMTGMPFSPSAVYVCTYTRVQNSPLGSPFCARPNTHLSFERLPLLLLPQLLVLLLMSLLFPFADASRCRCC